MVKIRLKRMGAKKAPFYRIVVADSRTPRDGKAIQELGYYDPTKQPAVLKVDVEAAQKWIRTGAKPSETVRALLKKAGAFNEIKEIKEIKEVQEAPEINEAQETGEIEETPVPEEG